MNPLKLLFATTLTAAATALAADPATPKPAAPVQAADVAAPKLGPDGAIEAGFANAHERFLKIAAEGKARLLFIGDSITQGWGQHPELWEKAFGAYQPANFGIGGDRTQHVLWRLENGELDGFQPKLVVLMIGTNNTSGNSAEEIAQGIEKIVGTIRGKVPEVKILLLGVFPREQKPEAKRAKLEEVNARIQKLGNERNVFFLNIGARFLEPDGTISPQIMPDFVHLSTRGYEIWAEAIGPKIAELMK
jgi:lysophospholipase L1-like esterase